MEHVPGTTDNFPYENKNSTCVPKSHSRRNPSSSRHMSDSSSSSETGFNGVRRKSSKEGDEHCLARAIQAHVKQLTDNLPFKECELADAVVNKGCITEDECRTIRDKSDRKTQVREIILLVKTRSYEIMANFLDAAKNHCPSIVEDIWKQYKINIDECRPKSKGPCSICNLKASVDVKRVVDALWSKECIDDALVREINASKDVTGRQDKFWEAIVEKIKSSRQGIEILCQALEVDDHYTHISRGLHKFLSQTEPVLQCTCLKLHAACISIRRPVSINSESGDTVLSEESILPAETSQSEADYTDIEQENMTDENLNQASCTYEMQTNQADISSASRIKNVIHRKINRNMFDTPTQKPTVQRNDMQLIQSIKSKFSFLKGFAMCAPSPFTGLSEVEEGEELFD